LVEKQKKSEAEMKKLHEARQRQFADNDVRVKQAA